MEIAPRKVLLIDNEMQIPLTVSQAFRDTGPYFITATNAGEALRKMEVLDFDLFLLALDLQDQQSSQLLQVIDERFSAAPVIMMSNNHAEYCELTERIDATNKRGSWQLVEKNFNLDLLTILIERCLYEWERSAGDRQIEDQEALGKRNHLRSSYVQSAELFIDAPERGHLEEKTVKATVTDVSDGGLGLITKYPLEAAQSIKLSTSSADKVGIVAWTALMDNHICRAGIQFC